MSKVKEGAFFVDGILQEAASAKSRTIIRYTPAPVPDPEYVETITNVIPIKYKVGFVLSVAANIAAATWGVIA